MDLLAQKQLIELCIDHFLLWKHNETDPGSFYISALHEHQDIFLLAIHILLLSATTYSFNQLFYFRFRSKTKTKTEKCEAKTEGVLVRHLTQCSNLSNFNYKPQKESCQQHLALYMDRHLRSVAIMIEVTSWHMKCTHFNLNYSRMPAIAQHQYQNTSCMHAGASFSLNVAVVMY